MTTKRNQKFFSWLSFASKHTAQERKKKKQQLKIRVEKKISGSTDLMETPKNPEKTKNLEPALIEGKNSQCQVVDMRAEEIVTIHKKTTIFQETDKQKKVKPTQEKYNPENKNFFSRLKKSLLKTRQKMDVVFFSFFCGKKIDDELLKTLEEQLLISDVGLETTKKIINQLTSCANRESLDDVKMFYSKLREEMTNILFGVDELFVIENKLPYVILMVGVNGVGKTTTIGKLARQYQDQGKSVMLAAGDTFRAAAVEQLQAWGEYSNIPVISQHSGADPASVIFDAMHSAKSNGIDVLIADTSGILQNKTHLMEELKKIVRVMKKIDQQAPHEVMLTLDASTGQNAINQTKAFYKEVGVTGIILTKLDGTAKGGVIFAIADQFNIPIRYIGIGEGIYDLRPFVAHDFIEALFIREG